MAVILEFNPTENERGGLDSNRTPEKLPRGHSAEIIIFPGVRIEHHKEDEKTSAPSKARKRTKRVVRRKR